MTTDQCERVWQVEALEDGRLEPKDRASFERHSQACVACSAELVRFRELQRVMSEAPAAERTDLERRRARIALLGEANRRVVERHAPLRSARVWALVAALPVLVLCAMAAAHFSSRALPGFDVVSIAHADWHADKVGTTSRVSLNAGVASFHVEHVAAGARFLVLLPDGEIEVRGTRFVVDVAGNHTRSVLVTEGVVALRLGGTVQLLHSGDRWQRAPEVRSLPANSGQTQELPPAPALAADVRQPPAPVDERQPLVPALGHSRAARSVAPLSSVAGLGEPAGTAASTN